MSGPGYAPRPPLTAWQRYLDREHAARDAYLAVTADAQDEYLTGPWPNRDAYQEVERRAWTTYYAAGRAAWQSYRAECDQTAPPPPPPPATRTPDASARTIYPEQPYDRDATFYPGQNGGN